VNISNLIASTTCRFLFIIFLAISLINTFWCIFASPFFPDSESEDDETIPDIDHPNLVQKSPFDDDAFFSE
jgi:hypothetical protein